MSDGIDMWVTCLGKPLGHEAAESALGMVVPQRGAGGAIKEYRLGSGRPVYLMLSPGKSEVVGPLELTSQPGLRFISDETEDGPRYLAHWLLDAKPPYVVAVAGKASLGPHLVVTTDDRFGVLCQSSGNLPFDMTVVRRSHELLAPFEWRTAASTLHLMTRYQRQPNDADRLKLQKAFAKTPGLGQALSQSGLKPDSGEYTLMGWLNREPKTEKAQ